MGNALYSQADLQMIRLANRLMNAERKRQDIGGVAATEAGKIALHYAERELERIYGFDAGVQALSLAGVEDERQVQKILEAADRITGSKMLTVKGRKEAYEKGMETFFQVEERGTPVTYEEKQLYAELTRTRVSRRKGDKGTEYTLFDRLKEFQGGYEVGTIKDAVNKMVENDISSEEITELIKEYIFSQSKKQKPTGIYDYLGRKKPGIDWRK